MFKRSNSTDLSWSTGKEKKSKTNICNGKEGKLVDYTFR
jgi:hypothetical protein